MSLERQAVVLYPDIVDKAVEEAVKSRSGEYAGAAYAHMMQQQPVLYSYIEKVRAGLENKIQYDRGVAVTYNIFVRNYVSPDWLLSPINEQTVKAQEYASWCVFSDEGWNSEQWIRDQLRKRHTVSVNNDPSGLFVFFNQLRELTPRFATLARYMLVNKIQSPEEKKNFLRGIFDVCMPFFPKLDTKYAEQAFENYQLVKLRDKLGRRTS